jgi:hypothetical protein
MMFASWTRDKPVKLQDCFRNDVHQSFTMSESGEIKRENLCLDYSQGSIFPISYSCHGQKGTQVGISFCVFLNLLRYLTAAMDIHSLNSSNIPQPNVALHDTYHIRQHYKDGDVRRQSVESEMDDRKI